LLQVGRTQALIFATCMLISVPVRINFYIFMTGFGKFIYVHKLYGSNSHELQQVLPHNPHHIYMMEYTIYNVCMLYTYPPFSKQTLECF
jgi:hypothetical protein